MLTKLSPGNSKQQNETLTEMTVAYVFVINLTVSTACWFTTFQMQWKNHVNNIRAQNEGYTTEWQRSGRGSTTWDIKTL